MTGFALIKNCAASPDEARSPAVTRIEVRPQNPYEAVARFALPGTAKAAVIGRVTGDFAPGGLDERLSRSHSRTGRTIEERSWFAVQARTLCLDQRRALPGTDEHLCAPLVFPDPSQPSGGDFNEHVSPKLQTGHVDKTEAYACKWRCENASQHLRYGYAANATPKLGAKARNGACSAAWLVVSKGYIVASGASLIGADLARYRIHAIGRRQLWHAHTTGA